MLLSADSQKVLAASFVCCTGCGLPCVGETEVCPMCGSTSWGWRNRGLKKILSQVFWSLAVGEFVAHGLAYVLEPFLFRTISFIMGIVSIVAPVQHFVDRSGKVRGSGAGGGKPETGKRTVLFALPFILPFALFRWFYPDLGHAHLIALFFPVWSLLTLDNTIFAAKKGPSIDAVSEAIDEQRVRLNADLKRVSDEIRKLGTGKGAELLSALKEELEKGREKIAREIPVLDRLHEFCRTLRIYVFWRYCLLNIHNGLHKIRRANIDAFEAINKELRYAIMDLRLSLSKARESGNSEGTEIADYIESSLGIHECIRDALIARRAKLILAGVEELPAEESTISQDAKPFVEAEYGDVIVERLTAIHARVTGQNKTL